jgi:hypothetical protein
MDFLIKELTVLKHQLLSEVHKMEDERYELDKKIIATRGKVTKIDNKLIEICRQNDM